MTPLYLLPGLLCDPGIWAAQVTALSSGREIVTPDLRGFDSITKMAEAVLASAPGRLAIAGHSMGGRVALEMTRLAPARIDRVALLDTGIAPPGWDEPARRQIMIDLAYREGMSALADRWLPPMVHPDRLADTALMQGLKAMVCRSTPEIHAGQIRALLHRPDATPALVAIDTPLLIACGREDLWSPLAQHQAMAELAPHARLDIVEHCGHMSIVERPDAVSELLRSWLGW